MAIESNTFPQFGDADDASRFAQLVGHDSLTDYVGSGLELDPDFNNDELSVSGGVFYVSRESDTAASDGREIYDLGYVVQVESTTLALPDSGSSYVVADPDLGSTNNPSVELYDSQNDIPEEALEIGEVFVDDELVSEYNREPLASFDSIETSSVSISRSVAEDERLEIAEDDGMVVSGPFEINGVAEIDGTLTDTIGPIYGTGKIEGTGYIKAMGGGDVDPFEDN